MFQCLGLGSVETGGCGEDWWHPECLMGLPRDWNKTETTKKETTGDGETEEKPAADGDDEEETPLPPGFPAEDDFETFICFKCLDSNPWLKRYAGMRGFLPPVYSNGGLAPVSDEKPSSETLPLKTESQPDGAKKRKADPSDEEETPAAKRTKEEENTKDSNPEVKTENHQPETNPETPKPKHESLPTTTPSGSFSLFLKEDFRNHLCRCSSCYPNLTNHPQLREEEETYEPPMSEDGEANGGGSAGTSLLDRGEAALSTMDRVRAIEGAMVYNHLRDNLKEFLKPYAETGKAVSAEDIKGYFEKLRGDDHAINDAAGQASAASGGDGNGDGSGDNRREQGGMYLLPFGFVRGGTCADSNRLLTIFSTVLMVLGI